MHSNDITDDSASATTSSNNDDDDERWFDLHIYEYNDDVLSVNSLLQKLHIDTPLLFFLLLVHSLNLIFGS
jgi:hypothetical protein